jgi:glucuronoarabinoxylan endo-1,4-beta-xylanase
MAFSAAPHMNRPKKAFSFLTAAGVFFIALAAPSPSFPAVAIVDTGVKYQTIEGFGGGFVFGTYPYGRVCKDALYDSLFNKAGVSIVRLGNTYDPEKNNRIDEIPMMREIRQKWPSVKIILSSWSPPAYLKSNNSKVGLKGQDTATLKKVDGVFAYDAYGDYWLKSARHFQDSGVAIDWISIQNEPDFAPLYDGCVFTPAESPTMASYGKALSAVYAKISTLPEPIPLIGPDLLGIADNLLQAYMASPDMHANQLSALCHHFYTGADSLSMHSVAAAFPSALRYQTEYLANEDASGQAWFYHAQVMQQSLVIEGVSMYNVFALTYRQMSTHCLFSLDSAGGGYAARPIYYAFKHFSKSIHRGWRRVKATINEPGIRISAFLAPSGDSLAAVVINGNATPASFSLSLPGAGAQEVATYQTTNVKKYAFMGKIAGSGTVTMEPMSIMTLETPQQIAGIIQRRQNPPSFEFPRLIKAIPGRSGELSISLRVPSSLPNTLSVFDASGKRVVSTSLPKAAGHKRPLTYLLKGPFANSVYFVKLECAGAKVF